jgi:hypothetical protein
MNNIHPTVQALPMPTFIHTYIYRQTDGILKPTFSYSGRLITLTSCQNLEIDFHNHNTFSYILRIREKKIVVYLDIHEF